MGAVLTPALDCPVETPSRLLILVAIRRPPARMRNQRFATTERWREERHEMSSDEEVYRLEPNGPSDTGLRMTQLDPHLKW
jgi:hypothetical protein